MNLIFWKYEAAGSDFILIDGRKVEGSVIRSNGETTDEIPSELIRAMCDRHRGIGADGLIVLATEEGYDFRMLYYTFDGREVSMCGNGARCATLFAHHLGIGTIEKHFVGENGEHRARILSDNGENAIIEVTMNDVKGYEYSEKAFVLNTGALHYVEFVDDLSKIKLQDKGREIAKNERFKASGGVNVNFVEIARHGQIKIRTYEVSRDDEMLASGRGTIASAIATHLFAQNDVLSFTVSTPGGNLDVKFETKDRQAFTNVRLTGPAKRIYEGKVYSGNLI